MEEMNLVLFDDAQTRTRLLPFTFTRPVAQLRVGIWTIAEKWMHFARRSRISYLTEEYLSAKFPSNIFDDNFLVDGSILPDQAFVDAVKGLEKGQGLYKDGRLLAARGDQLLPFGKSANMVAFQYPGEVVFLHRPWDIFTLNGKAIQQDLDLLAKGRKSLAPDDTNRVTGNNALFIEEGARVQFSIFNTNDGPIYIGKDAEVMEGCLVRGPFALCEHSTLKMGAKIYGGTTIGPHCKVGGEVNNSVIFGYSNKAHDGFLGNSVLGEWCNLGADTNNSNLKNNYDAVKVWGYEEEAMVETGLMFCGMFMGDHSKSGINTMFNTGSLIGISANVFGGAFPNTMIPSFSWGGGGGFTTYHLNKAYEVAARVMERRNLQLTQEDKDILHHVFEITAKYRKSQLELNER